MDNQYLSDFMYADALSQIHSNKLLESMARFTMYNLCICERTFESDVGKGTKIIKTLNIDQQKFRYCYRSQSSNLKFEFVHFTVMDLHLAYQTKSRGIRKHQ